MLKTVLEEKLKGTKLKVSSQIEKYKNNPSGIAKEIEKLKVKMKKMASKLDFEEAAKIRDEIKRLELFELSVRDGGIIGHEDI